ncbi:unnamed protein product, partial [Pylaiella littoralis]
MEAEEMRLMGQLLQKLSQRDLAAIFNQPVMASEYPDYHQIVSTPMDLGTIQENIRQGIYPSLEACAKDVRTVWTNAYLYNPAKSVVAQGARALSKVFEGMYNKINPSDFNYAREPNVDERNKFSRDIYRVEDSQLAEAVGLLEQRCPDAVVRNNEEGYFVVKVDALPSPVFWEVELYLRKRLCNQPDRTKKKIPTTLRPPPESMARLSGRKRSGSAGGNNAFGGIGGGGDGDEGGSCSVDVGGGGGADKKRKNGDFAAAAAAPAASPAAGATMTNGSKSYHNTSSVSDSSTTTTPSAAGEGGGPSAGAGAVAVPSKTTTTATTATSKPAATTAARAGSGRVGWRGDLLVANTSFREQGRGGG